MKFDGNVDWGVGAGVQKVVGAGVGRVIVDEVYSDVDDKVGEGFEICVGVKLSYGYDRSWRWNCFLRWHKYW